MSPSSSLNPRKTNMLSSDSIMSPSNKFVISEVEHTQEFTKNFELGKHIDRKNFKVSKKEKHNGHKTSLYVEYNKNDDK